MRESSGQAAAPAAACLVLLALAGCAHGPVDLGSAAPATAAHPRGPVSTPVPIELATDLPQSGQWRNGFDLADLDGDGYLDLLHPAPRKGGSRPVVFLGDGQGGFRRWSEASFPDRAYDYGDAVAIDVDGDGRLDAAFAVHLHGLIATRQEAPGVFVDASDGLPWSSPGAGFSARTLAAADWDGDSRMDLVAFGEGPVRFGAAAPALGLGVFLNRPDGWTRLTPPAPYRSFGDSLAVADVDGDGRPDAVTSGGGASGRDLLHLASATGWRDVEVDALPPGSLVGAVAAADTDGDGRAEALVSVLEPSPGRWSWSVHLLHWDGERLAGRELLGGEGRNLIRAAAMADLDGDGPAEAVLLQDDGGLRIVPLAAPERAVLVPAPAWRDGCSGYGLQLGDLTGDGRPEIVAGFAGEGSVMELGGRCSSGGGLQAWSVASAP